jgi:hypothetical protein
MHCLEDAAKSTSMPRTVLEKQGQIEKLQYRDFKISGLKNITSVVQKAKQMKELAEEA